MEQYNLNQQIEAERIFRQQVLPTIDPGIFKELFLEFHDTRSFTNEDGHRVLFPQINWVGLLTHFELSNDEI